MTVHPARHLLRAKDLVDARYFEPLDVSALARAAHLSPPSSAASSTGLRPVAAPEPSAPAALHHPSGNQIRIAQLR